MSTYKITRKLVSFEQLKSNILAHQRMRLYYLTSVVYHPQSIVLLIIPYSQVYNNHINNDIMPNLQKSQGNRS